MPTKDELDNNSSIFSFLDNEEDDNLDNLSGDEGKEPDKDEGQEPKKPEQEDKKYLALEKKTKDMAEFIRQQSERLKGLEANADVAVKIKNALSDDTSRDEVEIKNRELEEREAFDEDGYGLLRKKLGEMESKIKGDRLSDIEEYIVPLSTSSSVKDAKEKIDKKYSVDWENPKVVEKIKNQLLKLDPEYKQKEPVKALIHAAYHAKVLKKRSASDLPYMEESMGGVFVNKKAKEREAENYIKGIKDASVTKLFNKI